MDRFEEKLSKSREELERCQKERQLDSCLSCEEWKECEIRKRYVQSVYESMSKGKEGGFEF